jgi:solute carrier family 25 phosphate transporter 23/24/25/41
MHSLTVSLQSGNGALKPQYGPSVMRLRETVSQPVVAAFCAGGVAGAVSRTVVSPLERLKILYQVQSVGREEYKLSVGKGLMKMWKEEGWRGFMRGNGTNCVRIVPYSAVQFGSYNFYKKVGTLHLPTCTDDSMRRPTHLIMIISSLSQLQGRS